MTRKVGSVDVESLLQTGCWNTKRAKSPQQPLSATVRANQSSKLDRTVPRYPINASNAVFYTRHYPPPASVEDEETALAKEHGGTVSRPSEEEPKSRGDVDQEPVILEIAEFIPERRFVLLSSDTDDDFTKGRTTGYPPITPINQANTGRKVHLDNYNDKEKKQPEIQKRRSRADLPRLATDGHIKEPRASQFQRASSATCVNQKPRDYFSSDPESSRPSGDAFLSPVIKHATKGRDRAYWNFYPGANGPSAHSQHNHPRSEDRGSASSDRRGQDGYARSPHLSRPGSTKRTHSAIEVPRKARRAAERHSSYREESYSRPRRNEPPSPPLSRKHTSPPRLIRKNSTPTRAPPEPPRLSRRKSSYNNHPTPPREEDELAYLFTERGQKEPPKLSRRESSYSNRPAPPREHDELGYSSEESREYRSQRSRRDRPKSTVIHDDRHSLMTPDVSRLPPFPGPKSRIAAPLASPMSSQMVFAPYVDSVATSRTSTTSIATRDRRHAEIERPISPISSIDSSSSRRSAKLKSEERLLVTQSHTPSRTPSLRSDASSSKPVIVPTPTPIPKPLPISIHNLPSLEERRRSQLPPSPSYSRQSSSEKVPDQSPYWNHEPLYSPRQSFQSFPTPRESSTDLDQLSMPISSYKRYSEEVSTGLRSGLPECPRRRPRAGLTDWLTLPRQDNFNICPSCYDQVFAQTKFRAQFVPAPLRTRDKEIACDLGASPWFRIAWLMTRKYHFSDLRLLQGVANVIAKNQPPCYGPQPVTRIWYSIKDPWTKRSVPDFKVCLPCAKAVEVLFPNLTGVFTPLGNPVETTRGVCSLHFHPDRNRFAMYFDMLESTYDRALNTHSAPDIQRLADEVSAMSGIEECARNDRIRDASWYVMKSINDFKVCEECFLEVVYPQIVAAADGNKSGGDGGIVVRNFYQKPETTRAGTACQLYSPRMRAAFRKACRTDDLGLLEVTVDERIDNLASLREKMDRLYLRMNNGLAPGYAAEKERLMREYRRWE